MKTLILTTVLILASTNVPGVPSRPASETLAETNTPQTVTLEEAVAASGWTIEELIAALELVEAKYNRDVKKDDGRKAWHGKRMSSVLDVTNGITIVTYEDGTVFRDSQKKTALDRVKEANARLARPVITNGVPKALAEARMRAAANKTNVVEVTQDVGAGR